LYIHPTLQKGINSHATPAIPNPIAGHDDCLSAREKTTSGNVPDTSLGGGGQAASPIQHDNLNNNTATYQQQVRLHRIQ